MTVIRLGLCCLFNEVPIKFHRTTVKKLTEVEAKEGKEERLKYVSVLVLNNAISLKAAIAYCAENRIGCFRICSELFPCYTHPTAGYTLNDLPNTEEVLETMRQAGSLAQRYQIRLAMHPSQFVVLNSPTEKTVDAAIEELEYHAVIAELVSADVINIHVGGAYGDKVSAIERFEQNFQRLSERVKSRLTLENDDTRYCPEDVIPLCRRLQIPFVYDVHHHRCTHAGRLSEESIRGVTEAAKESWLGREPLFHISSPISGWDVALTRPHHQYIDYAVDYPQCWKTLGYSYTVEVEAKAKESAIAELGEHMTKDGLSLWHCPIDVDDSWESIGLGKRKYKSDVKKPSRKSKKLSATQSVADPPCQKVSPANNTALGKRSSQRTVKGKTAGREKDAEKGAPAPPCIEKLSSV